MKTFECLWQPPPADLTLSSQHVHIWRASLDLPQLHIQHLQQSLTADELSRAARLYFEKDRQHFIAARGLLRTILSRYLDYQPDQLRFCYNHYGKPDLASISGWEMLSFNLSHSHGLALYAITRNRKIGIDLEYMRPNVIGERIAERFFSPREVASLHALPTYLQQEAFFDCWTRKEAYIKAQGKGLSLPLDQFDVSLAPGEPAELLATRDDPQEASRWSLKELHPGTNYRAALAVEGHDWQLTCWQWTH